MSASAGVAHHDAFMDDAAAAMAVAESALQEGRVKSNIGSINVTQAILNPISTA